jgi:acetyltransferase
MNASIWQNFLQPKTVAVIGATDKVGSVGHSVLRNLTNGLYEGAVCPVNPKRDSVLGYKCYPSIGEIQGPVDLAVITTPSSTVPDLITQCGKAGVKSVIVLSAGFEEFGEAGHELGEQVLANAREYGVRLIGPNCLGMISPRCGLNATFSNGMPQDGSVAFISQSGALGTAILDWSLREHVGFSAFISTGAMLDIGWAELIDALADDPQTRSIVMYMESVGDARSFLSAARELALVKPIIVLKAGRHEEGAAAARSHTGAMAGSDDVLDAAFDRCGVLRVTTIAELFYMAEVLSKQPRPHGPNIAVVTNAGGPGVLAADALADVGGTLGKISDATIATLDAILPPSWSRTNPIDILGDATPERYAQAVKTAINDPNTDAVLAILTPQAMTEPTETALRVSQIERPKDKPLLTSWMGGKIVEDGITVLKAASIPSFPFPDTAIKIGHYMWRYSQVLKNLYETPQLLADKDKEPNRDLATSILTDVKKSGRSLLTEFESKQLLKSYHIPIVETYLANTEDRAAIWAERLGYPIVLKLHSERITHKSDVGGVQLNLQNEADVRSAYRRIERALEEKGLSDDFGGVTVQKMVKLEGFELIVGSRTDIQFGPVLLFGTGGRYTEIVKDYGLGLPPLNSTLARRMIEKTKAY